MVVKGNASLLFTILTTFLSVVFEGSTALLNFILSLVRYTIICIKHCQCLWLLILFVYHKRGNFTIMGSNQEMEGPVLYIKDIIGRWVLR